MTVSSHMITSLYYSVFKNHRDVVVGFVHDIDIRYGPYLLTIFILKFTFLNKISVDFVNLSHCSKITK